MKKSLGIRNWESAQKLVRDWEAGSGKSTVPMKEACERFFKDAEARRLGPAQLGKYRLLTGELKKRFSDRVVWGLTVDDLREYRESWKVSPVTARKKLERLRTFFRFCVESGWIENNPAKLLKPPTGKTKPTLPFTDDEVKKLEWACEVYPDRPKGRRKQIHALILLLKHSGLRIRDAVTLSRTRISEEGKLFLYTQKTGVPVWLPLPAEVHSLLWEGWKGKGDYLFWSGNGNPKGAVADWQRSFKKLCKLAGVQHGHFHRYRDYFAVKLLEKGVPLETVSILLGHSNTLVTNRHYAPWVKSRQESLEREVKKTWT
jgi:integrase/recombinase XerD